MGAAAGEGLHPPAARRSASLREFIKGRGQAVACQARGALDACVGHDSSAPTAQTLFERATIVAKSKHKGPKVQPLSILVIPGSNRKGSLSSQLAQYAAGRATVSGAHAEVLELRSLGLPVYDGDVEASVGVPEGAHRLRDAIAGCDAVLVVTPEYNGFPTPLVINAFDWLSRIPAVDGTLSGLSATANKPVGLMSASPGAGGALRSMNFMRQYLQMAFAMLVVPQQFALGVAHEAFDEAGTLKDARAVHSVETVLRSLSKLAIAMRVPG